MQRRTLCLHTREGFLGSGVMGIALVALAQGPAGHFPKYLSVSEAINLAAHRGYGGSAKCTYGVPFSPFNPNPGEQDPEKVVFELLLGVTKMNT